MKKAKILLCTLAIGILTFCMFAFAACGGIPGTYYFKSMNANGMYIEAGEPYMGVTISEEYMVIEIEDDGTFSLKMMNGAMTAQGTWKDLGNGTIEMVVDGDAQICECDGDTLIMSMDGETITFEK